MHETIRKAINNKELRKDLKKKGKKRSKEFSWKITYQKTKSVYMNLLQ